MIAQFFGEFIDSLGSSYSNDTDLLAEQLGVSDHLVEEAVDNGCCTVQEIRAYLTKKGTDGDRKHSGAS